MTTIDSLQMDTAQAQAALAQLEQHAGMTSAKIMRIAKKGYQTITLLADIIGKALPMWFSLMSQAAFMASAMFAELAAAETVSGFLAAKALVTFSIATLLFYRGLEIQAEKSQVEMELNSILRVGNIWS